MSDNVSKLPGKNIQIILTVVFIVAALVLVAIVKPFGTVHIPDKANVGATPGNAPAGVPPTATAPPK